MYLILAYLESSIKLSLTYLYLFYFENLALLFTLTVSITNMYNSYFSDPNNDKEALKLGVRVNCTFLVHGYCSRILFT